MLDGDTISAKCRGKNSHCDIIPRKPKRDVKTKVVIFMIVLGLRDPARAPIKSNDQGE